MNDAARRPPLPEPGRPRWQPLRIGLVELYFYDAEEFWFRDGHLLLRGNNGTGKSKVLSLTLPFLLDASLRSERIEPDGDRSKRMEWNLLMGGAAGERRTGYAWIEFGRRDEADAAHYLTLGCGLRGVAGKPVEPWYFQTTLRIGDGLWLTTAERTALSRERLEAAIGSSGQVFDSAQAYRRAIDEQLFRLGEARYSALIDTLIQLRQPQLSKQPDEARLSHALSEALPPLDRGLLDDVAESFNRLDDLKRELEELDAMYRAVTAFELRYQSYARVAARRRAAEMRRAVTRFDEASREVNEAEAEHAVALEEVERLQALDRELALAIAEDEARLQALNEDPAHVDATRLDEARRLAEQAEDARQQADRRAGEARDRHERELHLLRERGAQADASRVRLLAELQLARELAAATGVAAALEQALTEAALPDGVHAIAAELPDRLHRGADESAQTRLRQIELLRRRLRQLVDAQRAQEACASERRARADDYDQAAAMVDARRREQRDVGDALLRVALLHLQNLRHLTLDAEPVLASLEQWIESGAGDNPLRVALQRARGERELALAGEEADLRQRQQALENERVALEAEAAALAGGQTRAPPAPYTRGFDVRRERAGAPLWQLVDFADGVDASARAGLEAALEASGLLDAWVTPQGALLDAATHDVQLLARAPLAGATLRGWLCPDIPEHGGPSAVSAAVVDALLASIAAGQFDSDSGEAWVSPLGAFRLGPVHGTWSKPQAELIGNTARQAARQRRLAQIAQGLQALAEQMQTLCAQLELLGQVREGVRVECDTAPGDEPLLRAQLALAEAERQRRVLQERLATTEAKLAAAASAVERVRAALQIEATDLGLPADSGELDALTAQLHDYRRSAAALAASLREHRRDSLELAAQNERERLAQSALAQAQDAAERQIRVAHQARTRFETLRATIGERVDALQVLIAAARTTLQTHGREREVAIQQRIEAGARRAAAAEKARGAGLHLSERSEARTRAIAVLQSFAASGLLQQALPGIELPPLAASWGVDAARTLARRVEQALTDVAAEDADWQRVQSQISADLAELQRAMSAQGHEAVSEVADDCMLVHIVYRSRAERPDLLRVQVEAERSERRMQLTANEREIIENHLQQEIAAELQRLIQDTERRVSAINAELDRRPTSTGVRYRLAWLPADGDDAPAGLGEARSRLLRTRAEAWSGDDRRVVGEFLSRRIDAERKRDDQAVQLDVLSAALDYRRWHRFVVQRKLSKSDPNWRPLSGPASSGEKALGLTVPLFAAASSFYESADPRSPRLVLLDEAFAGIDDDARRHCMALIREFDLDFVMTSEREWGCYAELPGVAISQLVRHENADAVFVSRWTWDGRERRAQPDPERRFPDAATLP